MKWLETVSVISIKLNVHAASRKSFTFVDISALTADFCTKLYMTVKQIYTWSPSLFEICQKMTKLCCFNQDNPHFSVKLHAELTDRMWTGSLRRLSGSQALQIWTQWTITSGAPCWKSTINSSWSLTQLMSWKSPCKLPGKSCHKNTSTRRDELHQVPDCL